MSYDYDEKKGYVELAFRAETTETPASTVILFYPSGGASTSSAEAIGLNLQRAIKAAGLSKTDIANVMRVI